MNVPEINIGAMSTPELREAYMDATRIHAARWAESKTDSGPSDMMRISGLDGKTPVERIEEMAAYNDHIAALRVELDVRNGQDASRLQASQAQAMSGGGLFVPGPGPRARSFGQVFAQSEELKEFLVRKGGSSGSVMLGGMMPDAENGYDIRAALMQTGAGWAPPQLRLPRVELSPLQMPSMLDVVPQMGTDADVIRYMEETTYTNNAAFVAQQTTAPTVTVDATSAATDEPVAIGQPIPEAALALTERTQNVEWLPISIPVTIQQLEDVAGIQGYIDTRLRFMLEETLSKSILTGNGTTPNILGTLNVTGIQTEAKVATDDIFDEIHKVIISVMHDGQAMPDTIVLHPNNWGTLRTEKDTDGNYKYGPPYLAGDLPVFGLSKVVTSHVTENTAVVGAYGAYSGLFVKSGIQMDVTDSHGYDFRAGILRVRAMLRVAMVHFRPKAFGTITGLNT